MEFLCLNTHLGIYLENAIVPEAKSGEKDSINLCLKRTPAKEKLHRTQDHTESCWRWLNTHPYHKQCDYHSAVCVYVSRRQYNSSCFSNNSSEPLQRVSVVQVSHKLIFRTIITQELVKAAQTYKIIKTSAGYIIHNNCTVSVCGPDI